VFQAVRELLFNIVKHADASKARVTMSCENGMIRTTVEDDGCGFIAQDAPTQGENRSGFGLFSIRERLNSQGGRLFIESQPGKGTRITMLSPMASEAGSHRKERFEEGGDA
jgi:signal transduction histidine kinase